MDFSVQAMSQTGLVVHRKQPVQPRKIGWCMGHMLALRLNRANRQWNDSWATDLKQAASNVQHIDHACMMPG